MVILKAGHLIFLWTLNVLIELLIIYLCGNNSFFSFSSFSTIIYIQISFIELTDFERNMIIRSKLFFLT